MPSCVRSVGFYAGRGARVRSWRVRFRVASVRRPSNHSDVELVIGATIYLTFCAFLILPHFGAPPIFGRMAIGLCASEFVASLGWSFSRSDCVDRELNG